MADTEQDLDITDEDVSGALAELDGAGDAAPLETVPDDGYDSIVGDEGPPRGPDGKFLPRESPPPDTPDAKTEEAPPAPPIADGAESSPAVAPADPFKDWQPFAFKADGVEATIPGIRANETHIVIPRDVWDTEFRPKHLANREAWQQERQQWQGRVGQAEQRAHQEAQQRGERELRADAITAEFTELLGNRERLQAFLEDFERQAPILQAQIERDTYKRQWEQREQAEQQTRQRAEMEQTFQRGADVFEQACHEMLKDPKYAGLVGSDDERDELVAELWDPKLVLVADRDYPHLNLRRGDLVPERETLTALLDRRAAFLQRRLSAVQRTASVEQRNAAAIASPATTPQTAKPATVPPPRRATPQARPTPQAPRPIVQTATITDEDRDSWTKDYDDVFR